MHRLLGWAGSSANNPNRLMTTAVIARTYQRQRYGRGAHVGSGRVPVLAAAWPWLSVSTANVAADRPDKTPDRVQMPCYGTGRDLEIIGSKRNHEVAIAV